LNPDPQIPRKTLFKNPLLYSSIAIVAVAAYVVLVFLSRYDLNRRIERSNAERQAEQRREEDRKEIEILGGSELAIRAFYISPAIIRRGESAEICYDVANAKTVTLDPPEAEVWPSHSRCFHVTPRITTTYTLTISDAAGKTATQSVELTVR
jgi:hypothetical protein